MAHVVAVEQVGVPAAGVQAGFQQVGDGRLAGAGQTGEPQQHGLLAHLFGARLLAHIHVLHMNILRTAQGILDQARANGGVRQTVDEDEAAGFTVVLVGIEGDRLAGKEVAHADLVQRQLFGRQVLHGVDVDLVLGHRQGHRQGFAADFHQVGATGEHGLLVHPDQADLELVGHAGRVFCGGQHIAATAIDFFGQGQGDRLSGHGLLQVTVEGDDARDSALLSARQHAYPVTRTNHAAGDGAGEATEIQVGAVDPLHRHTERQFLLVRLVDLDGFQVTHQRGTAVPRHVFALLGDVLAP